MDNAKTEKNPSRSTTEPVVSTQTSSSHSRKKLIIFGLIGAILIILIGSALFVYFLQNKPKTPILAQISPTSQPTPKPLNEIPTDWKVYSNENYSFKYPNNYDLTENESVRVNYLGPTQSLGTEVYDGVILSFDQIKPLGDQLLLPYVKDDLGKQEEHVEVLKKISEIEINEINGYTYTVRGLGDFTFIYLQTPDEKSVVRINYLVADPENSGYQETLDKILSTFTFSN